MLAREMGWTIDYLLDMDIYRFFGVSKVIGDYYEEQQRQQELEHLKQSRMT